MVMPAVQDKEARLTALTRLALATREKVETATYVLYLEDTATFSTAVVVEACKRMETRVSWFPKVAELIEECATVAKRHQERQEERARAALPPPPASPEKLAWFRRKMHELIDSKSMK